MNIKEKFNLKCGLKNIPNELTNGSIRIGNVVKKNEKTNVYFSSKPCHDTGLVVAGKIGSGKDVYLKNYVNDCIKSGDNLVVIDYMSNNGLVSNIENMIPKDKMVVLDFDNIKNLQSLSYNEIDFDESTPDFDKDRRIHYKAQYILELLECLSENKLSNMAKRYFLSASVVVYSANQNASFKDIIDCLTKYDVRMSFINQVPKEFKAMLEDNIDVLLRINKDSNISGIEQILDLASLLNQSIETKYMINSSSENNLNFEDCFNDGKVILIKINNDIITNGKIRDMLTLFFVTKTYIACEEREKKMDSNSKKIHLIMNDSYQAPNTLKKINYLIPITRIVKLKLVISTQSLSQLSELIMPMRTMGFNYMFLSGIDKTTFRLLELDCSKYNVDELNYLEKYHSVNFISGDKGYYDPFITKLPSVLE